MIAPLSLTSVLTVVMAVICLSTLTPQSRGEVVRLWRLAIPATLAAVLAVVLLTGVFEVSLADDALWLAGAVIGGLAGRAKGWSLPLEVDHQHGLIRLRRSIDAQYAAIGVVGLAFLDFASAALEDAIVPGEYVAAAAALCASYIAARAVAIAVRIRRAPHVGLHDGFPQANPPAIKP